MDRTATFTLTELDLRRSSRLQVLGSIGETRTIIRLVVVWVVGIVGYAAVMSAVGVPWPRVRGSLPTLALALVGAILGVTVVLPLLLGPLVIRRRFRQEKQLTKPVSVRWDEEVYEAEQPGIQNRIPWADYAKRREDRHLFLFFMSDYNYQILPKRVLSEAQIADIRRILAGV